MTCLTWYFMMVNHQNVFIWRSLGDLVGADAAAAAAADVSSAFGQSGRVVVYKPVEQRQKKGEKMDPNASVWGCNHRRLNL